jgi:hypothetical protein
MVAHEYKRAPIVGVRWRDLGRLGLPAQEPENRNGFYGQSSALAAIARNYAPRLYLDTTNIFNGVRRKLAFGLHAAQIRFDLGRAALDATGSLMLTLPFCAPVHRSTWPLACDPVVQR